MKRKLFWWSAFFVAGIYASVIFGAEKVFVFSVSALVMMIITLYLKPALIDAGLIFCCACIMLGGFYISYENKAEKSFLVNFVGQTAEIEARVKDYPSQGKKNYTLSAEALALHTEKGKYVFKENCIVRLYDKECTLRPGDSVMLKAKVLLPQKSEKISEDYSLYLKTKEIYAILSVKKGNCTFLSENRRTFTETLTVVRKSLTERIYKYMQNSEAALLCAMLLGDKTGLSDEIQTSFSLSGLSHIVAVSGLHVNTICAMLYALTSFFGVSKRGVRPAAIGLILVYVPLTGMAVSSVRAGIVAVLFIAAELILRRADAKTSLAAAALIITLINPFEAFSVSFMLSFGATLGILIYCESLTEFLTRCTHITRDRKILYHLCTAFSVTFSAQIITTPIVLEYFGTFSLWAFVTNLFVPVLLLPVFAGGTFLLIFDIIFSPACRLIAFPLNLTLKAIIKVAEWFSKLGFGILKTEIDTKTVILYTVLALLMYLYLHVDAKNAKKLTAK